MKMIQGICSLCGELKNLSFEHVPPKSAFNNKPIHIQTHDHLFNQNSPFFGKRMTSNKGFGSFTLCESCNNTTGGWYARDFGSFAHQGMDIIRSLKKPALFITGIYDIMPLRVIKQTLTMFLCADKSGHLRSQKDLIEFIQKKEIKGIPARFKVFLYSTLSQKKRMMGYSVVYNHLHGIQKWSEINFQPFGYLLAEESHAAQKDQFDMSCFGNYDYDEKVRIQITTPVLMVDNPWIGNYTI